jgi:uncharacterized delta-60 repeat protein
MTRRITTRLVDATAPVQTLEPRLLLTAIPDPTFGTLGKLTTPGTYGAFDMDLAPGDKIVAVGYGNLAGDSTLDYEVHAARYLSDGSLDDTFGTSGLASVDFGGSSFGWAIAAQPDGKILVGGHDSGVNGVLSMARFNEDGSIDTDFGTSGVVHFTLDGRIGQIKDLHVLPDGRILAAGYSFDKSTDVTLIMVNADGSPDTNFGTAGVFLSGLSGNDEASKVALDSEGGFIVVGDWTTPGQVTNNHLLLARILPDGTLDQEFGGQLTQDSGGGDPILVGGGVQKFEGYRFNAAIDIHTDGSIFVGANTPVINQSPWTVFKFDSTGHLEDQVQPPYVYGTAGSHQTELIVRPDGSVLQAGYITDNFAVVGFTPDLEPDPLFGPPVITDFGGAIADNLDVIHKLALVGDTLIAAGRGSSSSKFALAQYLLPRAVTLAGTDANDEITVSLGGSVSVTINGVTETYDRQIVASLRIDAGAGNDLITLIGTATPPDGAPDEWIAIHADAGHDAVFVSSTGQGVRVYGDDGNDTLTGGNADDSLDGGAGNDALDGMAGDDSLRDLAGDNTLLGGIGADVLQSGPGNDSVYGEDGDDQITDSEGGLDLLDAGPGNDFVQASPGADTVYAGDGNDTVFGGSGADVIDGGEGNDTLRGMAGNDTITGDLGADSIQGHDGNDSLLGGGDDDFLVADAGNDRLDAGPGNDKAWGGDGDDFVLGDLGSDTLGGQKGNDTLGGGDGSDYLAGGPQNDSLLGKAGNDTLAGETGNDTLRGDTGNDRLTGGTGADLIAGNADSDTADYTDHTGTIVVTFDGLANDGNPNEKDNVLAGTETILRPPGRFARRRIARR